MEYSRQIRKILSDFHKGGITEERCRTCASSCCSHPGYALLENVEAIYDKYKKGLLKRDDFEFTPNLNIYEFTSKYFDASFFQTGKLFWKKQVVLFYPKTIACTGDLLTIPTNIDSYYNVRFGIYQENRWLNKGCVFLSSKVPEWPEDDGNRSRNCILHHEDSITKITTKPIGCVFHTCVNPREPKGPTKSMRRKWYGALALFSKDSDKWFYAIVAKYRK
jgi:hypothetical protein